MAKIPLFSLVNQLIQSAIPLSETLTYRNINRRQFVKASGALGLGVVATQAMTNVASAHPWGHEKEPLTAIIGGGVAGLTAAYRLAQAGKKPILFEGSNRLGGRMFTKRNFNNDGMFCELGGELVDTGHTDLIALCKELGVGIQEMKGKDKGDDLYFFNGKYFSRKELVDIATQTGAFVPLADRIAKDQEGLEDDNGWTEKAKKLDNMSLKSYLDSISNNIEPWVITMLNVAYTGEYGLPTEQQSALNLIDYINTDNSLGFEVFGESDESKRIVGGSSGLPEALVKALKGKISIRQNHMLRQIKKSKDEFELTFTTGDKPYTANVAQIIFALPFSTLRLVDGIDGLGLDPLKLRAIKELGYGTNAKIMFGTKERLWRTKAEYLPSPSNGQFFTDLSLQNTWETSREQKGKSGILTNFLGGDEGKESPAERIKKSSHELETMLPGFKKASESENIASFFWHKNPYSYGSYSCPKPGQYTTLLDVTGTPELGGTLLFAGEHTSTDFCGFMNGAVESGNRAARELLEMEKNAKAA